MKIVAVIPAYNEGTRVANVVQSAKEYVHDIIIIDDGSSDDTVDAARKSGAIVLQHIENCGAGAATMTGIDAAREMGADIIVTLDADEQHNPEDIPALLGPVISGDADIVFANRFGQKNTIPLIRRVFNAIGNMITFGASS